MFYIYKGSRPSAGAVALRNALGARILRSEGSTYRGRAGTAVINWGTVGAEASRLQGIAPVFLNDPADVYRCSNKLEFFRHFEDNAPHLIPRWTERWEDALGVLNITGRMYARTDLSGHSGRGIHLVCSINDAEVTAIDNLRRQGHYPVHIYGHTHIPEVITRAQLFTQGIVGKRTEFRVHVIRGEAVLLQVKLRRRADGEEDNGNSIVRNVAGGWVYGVNDAADREGAEQALSAAAEAIQVAGLDFGAVDIIFQHATGRAFVLEINTAPGLDAEGSALEAYVKGFNKIFEETI
ncbi:ATP-grasp enzyme [Pseudomonas phage bmx-p1]|nr:ATP-grasp enzyme [Pseudomonas phage bmx-p1]